MKKIEVVIRPEKLEELKECLLESGFNGITIFQVNGCGNQHGYVAYHRGNEVMMNTLPKVYIMTVVPDEDVERMIKIIKKTAYTGNVGDGKIFISPVEDVIRIRTDERGDDAL